MKGLIGFFDILGYKSFLKNNNGTAIESAKSVLKTIIETPEKVRDLLKEGSDSGIIHQIDHIVFSDTIVISLDMSAIKADICPGDARFQFCIFCGVVFQEMLKKGLPVRGAMVEGEFIFEASCLAGEAIVDAYDLCEMLDFAGLVCEADFGKVVMGDEQKENGGIFLKYLSPLKNGREDRHVHFNWLTIMDIVSPDEYAKVVADTAMYISRAFWDHNKDCAQAVDSKLDNTIKLTRRLMMQSEKFRLSEEATSNLSESKQIG